jgi:hypothetical protein
MKIYTTKKGDVTRLIFKINYSRWARVFVISLIDNKPKLSGYIHGLGGHGSEMRKPVSWLWFFRLLKDAAVKGELEFVD